jgi:hypothetical protein
LGVAPEIWTSPFKETPVSWADAWPTNWAPPTTISIGNVAQVE